MKILYLICLIYFGQSLSVQITQKPACFYVKSYTGNTQLTVNYQISGVDENKTEITIESENGDKLIKKSNTKEGALKQMLREKGTYYICFKSLSKGYKTVSFDFDMEGVDKEYAQSEQFSDMSKELSRTNRNFQTIYRNQNWITDRENAHQMLLEQTQQNVKWCASAKIGILLIIAITQISVVYYFFKGKDFSGSV
ncbi:unnamed protein product (macronuclear) [Paramecium tetraurelia]|uniref:Chromosome undetermined scaffold_1, whole genome shotgun sequence n=1 Tax=Paramecium tetraurelia TaxID=5888 RepID=Q6BFP5_PARTE|nr:emp24/gp25L/p24 family of membrane trafficking proteins [Paramecium tetraurelia strain d4-2]XP_001423132.1 uncharacterized protein GSPATT00000169001 [Paramecium tetraurelia]CAH03525.1 emp24/gp25L/p24 family of membrane trafficking proteins, putative [Paramecium tetraurelia]CAK55734.1 unnamed protein product [Paramecium tetraurelia]|eukprot:XP_001423132.1 hypothetical protein (macronuclear) [Paramecium tetraurelia strain d4-2]